MSKWKEGWKVILIYENYKFKLMRVSATDSFRLHTIDYPKEEVVVRPDKAVGGPLAVFKSRYHAERFARSPFCPSGKRQIVRCLYLPSEETELYECLNGSKWTVSTFPKDTALAEKVICLE